MEDDFVSSPRPEGSAGGAPDLRSAVQRARIELAERSDIASDLRAAEYAHLDLLKRRLAPVFADLPRDTDLFNHGLVPGERPRLYVDMIAFVEMSRDRRTYRFLADTRSGRQTLGETDDIAMMAEAVTNYLGRRIVERERALAGAAPLASTSSTLELAASTTSIEPLPEASSAGTQTGGRGFFWFLLGALVGTGALLIALNWDNAVVPHLARFSDFLKTY